MVTTGPLGRFGWRNQLLRQCSHWDWLGATSSSSADLGGVTRCGGRWIGGISRFRAFGCLLACRRRGARSRLALGSRFVGISLRWSRAFADLTLKVFVFLILVEHFRIIAVGQNLRAISEKNDPPGSASSPPITFRVEIVVIPAILKTTSYSRPSNIRCGSGS